MTNEHVVGRVGGLAAALGVGAAIWLCAPVATADETSAGTSSTGGARSSDSSAASSSRQTGTRPARTRREERARNDEVSAVVPTQNRRQARDSLSSRRRGVSEETVDVLNESATEAESASPVDHKDATRDRRHGSAPAAPAWVVAAAARRELGGHETSIPDTADTSIQAAAAPSRVTLTRSVISTGHQSTSAVFSGDGTRALVSTSHIKLLTGAITTRVSVVNTANGFRTGAGVTLSGGPSSQPIFTSDGKRAVVATHEPGTGSQVAVINTVTGRRVGATLNLTSDPNGPPSINVDHTGVLIITGSRVTVVNAATGARVGTSFALDGAPAGPAIFSPDGTYALVATGASAASSVAVIDMATGELLSAPVSLEGAPIASPSLNADRTRALISTATHGVDDVTWATVFDTATGALVGSSIAVGGTGGAAFNLGGNRVLVSTQTFDPATAGTTTTAALVDAITGTAVGAPYTVDGAGTVAFTPDGGRVLVTVHSAASSAATTRVAVLDAATGAQIGSTVTVTGGDPYSPVFSTDGTRAIVATSDYDDADPGTLTSSAVAVIDTTTGGQVGATLTFTTGYPMPPRVYLGGTRALLVSTHFDPATSIATTSATTVDLTTGAQVGTTVTLPGDVVPYAVSMTTDGTRAVLSTYGTHPVNGVGTTWTSMIDTTTGGQIGATIGLTGHLTAPPVLDAGHGRLLLAVESHNDTQLAILDITTGTQAGTTLNYPGGQSPVFSADSGLAMIAIDASQTLRSQRTEIAVVDTTTGTQIGPAITVAGIGSGAWSADGRTVALVATTYHFLRLSTTARVSFLKVR